ncbi:MAG: neuromedin U [Myxococcales bacterium]
MASARASAEDATDLQKKTQNPVADLASVPFQFNFNSGGDLKDRTQSVVNFQPVVPLPVTDRWNVIVRPVIPIVNTPTAGGGRKLGLADIQPQLFFTPADAGKIVWGLGPVLSFPTATNDALRTGQWGAGPAGVLVISTGHWVVGLLSNNVWRVAGSRREPKLNAFTLQPFINFNFGHGWALSFAPLITANWTAPSRNTWTVPLGAGVSKVHAIGKQPVNLSLQYYRNVAYPDGSGANQLRIVVAFLFPKVPMGAGPMAAPAPVGAPAEPH